MITNTNSYVTRMRLYVCVHVCVCVCVCVCDETPRRRALASRNDALSDVVVAMRTRRKGAARHRLRLVALLCRLEKIVDQFDVERLAGDVVDRRADRLRVMLLLLALVVLLALLVIVVLLFSSSSSSSRV